MGWNYCMSALQGAWSLFQLTMDETIAKRRLTARGTEIGSGRP